MPASWLAQSLLTSFILQPRRSNLRQMCVSSFSVFACLYPVPSRLYGVWNLESNTSQVGKTLAYTSIRFTNEQDELVARGSHTKYVALAWKDPKNITDELSPRPEKAA
jgi:hypothetical protein